MELLLRLNSKCDLWYVVTIKAFDYRVKCSNAFKTLAYILLPPEVPAPNIDSIIEERYTEPII